MFRSSRGKGRLQAHHVQLQMAIRAPEPGVEKAWRIEQLGSANHAYMEMLAFVSHEIKNPVASHGDRREACSSEGYLGPLDASAA